MDELRVTQTNDETLGLLWRSLYSFAARVADRFYNDVLSLPSPVISFEPEHGSIRGSYTPKDGLALHDRININIFVLSDGIGAALVLAHEMVHMAQHHLGMDYEAHDEWFHARMLEYGIETVGEHGRSVGFDTRWTTFLQDECADLELGRFVLPGKDRKPPRRMHKHQCPGCGSSFHCRRELNVLCRDCDAPFEIVS